MHVFLYHMPFPCLRACLRACFAQVTVPIHVRNVSSAPALWSLCQPPWEEVHPADSPLFRVGRAVELSFTPSSGVLPPKGVVEVQLHCKVRLP